MRKYGRFPLILASMLLLSVFGINAGPASANPATGPQSAVAAGEGDASATTTETGTDAFDSVRTRWFNKLTGNDRYDPGDPDMANTAASVADKASNPEGTGYWDTMNKSPGRAYLWSDLASTTESSHVSASYVRLKAMALAYAMEGSRLHRNEALRSDIIGGLDWMYAKRYHEKQAEYKNWWDWEIGSPQNLNDTIVLMYDRLTQEQIAAYVRGIDRFVPDPSRRTNLPSLKETGANLLDKALVVAIRGVVAKNGEKIAQAGQSLAPVFLYVKDGDGFYEDGSFVQHDVVAYTGSYGAVLIGRIPDMFYLLNDTPWAITDPNAGNVYKWVTDSFRPLVYKGAMMDMVRGRAISREGSSDHGTGRSVVTSLLRLAEGAPPDRASEIKRMAKAWIRSDTTFANYAAGLSLFDMILVKKLMNDDSIAPQSERIENRVFAGMDRVVHLRPGFGFGISMSSKRIASFEMGTASGRENPKGWHTGYGMTYLYNDDLRQYSNDYWPTVDMLRLPGTTTDGSMGRQYPNWNFYLSPKSWVGGSSIDGLYGAAGMEFDLENSSLTGKKSWFMFDDEIVALGSGIAGGDNRKVETIVENRMLRGSGDNRLTVNGEAKPNGLGWSETMSGVKWAHLEGNVPGADTGYYFPDAASVSGLREARTGAWSDINEAGGANPVTRHYLSLALDHGANPSSASYAYVLLPNKDAAATSGYSERPDADILVHTPDVHAVRERKLGITAANFWNAGTAGFIRSYQPASVIVKEAGDILTIAVSDPTQSQSRIAIELGKTGVSLLSKDDNVTLSRKAPYIRLEVDTAGSIGKTFTIKLKYNPNAPEHLPPVGKLEMSLDHALHRGDETTVTTVVYAQEERIPGGSLTLNVPDGWTAQPASFDVPSLAPGESRTFVSQLAVPKDAAYGQHQVSAAWTSATVTQRAAKSVEVSRRNAALGKPAAQASTAYGGVPERAVDGNTNGTYGAGSVTHTAERAVQPWWQADLGASMAIEEIVVWNRTDCCSSRLSNYYVIVSGEPFASGSLAETLKQPGVWFTRRTETAGRPTVVPVGHSGRYVRIQLEGTNALSLAEVQVVPAEQP
ncbi:polysaccharide lyase family 8 super-sandwich domain-containing protein [Paenibacillus sp. GYB003]|uniref:polysaccharide lyase family 8 super-sandwich domain-containing protein n=1 Tax=Paenibacillus sp. GYB003 TaxID=2994392 RepID=UPI002F96576B